MKIETGRNIPDVTLEPGESIWITLSNGRQIRIKDNNIWPAIINVYNLDSTDPTVPTDTLKVDKSWVDYTDNSGTVFETVDMA